ncbi:MAG: hypothetical protein WC612_06375 [Bdellovibrionales bacterium]|jgi:hypothetical protein
MTTLSHRAGRIGLLLVCLVSLGACSDLSARQQRVLTGGAIGTTVGAISTVAMGGCVACGAAIGGAVGAGSGYLYDYIENQNW